MSLNFEYPNASQIKYQAPQLREFLNLLLFPVHKKRFDVVCLILFKIITNNVRKNLCDRSFHTFEWIFGPKREADVTAEAERGNELVLYFMQIIYFADFIFAALHCCRLAAMAAEVKL